MDTGTQGSQDYENPSQRLSREPWRRLDRGDQQEFVTWAGEALYSRLDLGNRLYNSEVNGFQGDPLEHAIEEALDLLIYLWMERKRVVYDKTRS